MHCPLRAGWSAENTGPEVCWYEKRIRGQKMAGRSADSAHAHVDGVNAAAYAAPADTADTSAVVEQPLSNGGHAGGDTGSHGGGAHAASDGGAVGNTGTQTHADPGRGARTGTNARTGRRACGGAFSRTCTGTVSRTHRRTYARAGGLSAGEVYNLPCPSARPARTLTRPCGPSLSACTALNMAKRPSDLRKSLSRRRSWPMRRMPDASG